MDRLQSPCDVCKDVLTQQKELKAQLDQLEEKLRASKVERGSHLVIQLLEARATLEVERELVFMQSTSSQS